MNKDRGISSISVVLSVVFSALIGLGLLLLLYSSQSPRGKANVNTHVPKFVSAIDGSTIEPTPQIADGALDFTEAAQLLFVSRQLELKEILRQSRASESGVAENIVKLLAQKRPYPNTAEDAELDKRAVIVIRSQDVPTLMRDHGELVRWLIERNRALTLGDTLTPVRIMDEATRASQNGPNGDMLGILPSGYRFNSGGYIEKQTPTGTFVRIGDYQDLAKDLKRP